jgi:hypothetical protein
MFPETPSVVKLASSSLWRGKAWGIHFFAEFGGLSQGVGPKKGISCEFTSHLLDRPRPMIEKCAFDGSMTFYLHEQPRHVRAK